MTEGAFNCLIDKRRTEALASAINVIVKPGDVVVDAGSGTGVLSLLAAKSGAKKVYAIESDERNASMLERVFRNNGFGEVITCIHGDARFVALPEKVDLIICEMIATGLIEELQLKVAPRLAKYANPGANHLIDSYSCDVDLVDNNINFYGFCFDVYRYEYPGEKDLKSRTMTKKERLFEVSFSRPESQVMVDRRIQFRATKQGIINGVRLSGETTLGDGSKLGATFAYDYPIILPIEARSVERGQSVVLDISYELNGGMSKLSYSLV